MIKTSHSNAKGEGLIPGQGADIPHALWPINQNIKQQQHYHKLSKDFKNGLHQKKKTNITVFSGNLSGLGGLYGFTLFSKLHVSVL